MSFVKIKDNKSSVKLPTNKKKLKLEVDRTYFPGANGLTFFDGEDKCGINIEKDEFDLIEGVDEYEVFYANPIRENNDSDAKRRRINEIMDIIDGKENNDSRSKKSPDIPIPPKKVTKALYVGWKHRESPNEIFKQMITPFGGIKTVDLDRNKKYTFEDIEKISLSAMENVFNKELLARSVIDLGNFQEEVFYSFTDFNKKKNTDFWDFSNKLKIRNSQLLLYLLSTTFKSEDSVKVSFSTDTSKDREPSNISKKTVTKKSYTGTVLPLYQSKKKASSNVTIINNSDKRQEDPRLTNDNESQLRLSIPTIEESDIKFTNTVLGSGSFGSVILSIWKNTEVAVKKMTASEEMKYIYREINIIDKIRHPNLISIMGICSTESHFHIVMEYFRSQNLAIFMSKRDEMLDYAVKKNQNYSIALQMCKAITFLREFDPIILHKDIKPGNILINNFFMIKICDFGLSKMCDGSTALETTVGQYFRGTPLYIPPKILIDHTQGTAFSDVWSLTCCIVELFTERRIWNEVPNLSIPSLKKLVKTQKTPCLEGVPIVIEDTIKRCFEHEPKKRPNASILFKLFKRVYIDE